MRVDDLVTAMESIAPTRYAEEWDRVGLLVGDREREIKGPVLLTIDLTERVMEEAIEKQASAVVAYHPPIWDPLRRVTSETPRQRIILRAIESRIAVYSPHTALDAVPGGVAEWLCEGLSGSKTAGRIDGDCRALTPHGQRPKSEEVKIVTFVPPDRVDDLRSALASAGAGMIGRYRLCSFAGIGRGSFLGEEGTNPAVGEAGRIEQVEESRLEMVCSKAALSLALETLREFHPYEEPAIDVYDLAPKPTRRYGPGRRLVLDRPATVRELAERMKVFLKRERMRFALVGDDKPITHIGVCPGSGASLARLARQEGCEAYLTGEMSHHDIMGSLHSGMSVILGGHTSTERGYLPRLMEQLKRHMPRAALVVSERDRDPLELV